MLKKEHGIRLICLFLFVLVVCTTGCGSNDSGKIPDHITTDADPMSINPPEELPANFVQIYREAEHLYAMFTGYGSIEYVDRTIRYNGETYQEFRHADFSTLAEMGNVVRQHFSEEITNTLMNKTVAGAGCPLYLEQDGQLYRFGGYAAQWGYSAAEGYTWVPLGTVDGEHLVEVSASITEYGTTYTAAVVCRYVIEADGSIRFTEFPLIIEHLWDAFAQPSAQAPVSTITDIADWDRLAWVQAPYDDDSIKRAHAAYEFT
ncbi:MAG: hypothetical protein IJF49_03515 [Clostridia bacterium]|nr:hypothetical protein [Clostridia bacterium]